eukprot:7507157-Karenia_brevis.AAC.1
MKTIPRGYRTPRALIMPLPTLYPTQSNMRHSGTRCYCPPFSQDEMAAWKIIPSSDRPSLCI